MYRLSFRVRQVCRQLHEKKSFCRCYKIRESVLTFMKFWNLIRPSKMSKLVPSDTKNTCLKFKFKSNIGSIAKVVEDLLFTVDVFSCTFKIKFQSDNIIFLLRICWNFYIITFFAFLYLVTRYFVDYRKRKNNHHYDWWPPGGRTSDRILQFCSCLIMFHGRQAMKGEMVRKCERNNFQNFWTMNLYSSFNEWQLVFFRFFTHVQDFCNIQSLILPTNVKGF